MQLLGGEVLRPGAHTKVRKPCIHGVGAKGKGVFQAFKIPRGGQKFGHSKSIPFLRRPVGQWPRAAVFSVYSKKKGPPVLPDRRLPPKSAFQAGVHRLGGLKVLLVFLIGAGIVVLARLVGEEEVIVVLLGIQSRLDGIPSGTGQGSGRQTNAGIGVVVAGIVGVFDVLRGCLLYTSRKSTRPIFLASSSNTRMNSSPMILRFLSGSSTPFSLS